MYGSGVNGNSFACQMREQHSIPLQLDKNLNFKDISKIFIIRRDEREEKIVCSTLCTFFITTFKFVNKRKFLKNIISKKKIEKSYEKENGKK